VIEQHGIDNEGRVVGAHRATGVRPRFCDRLERIGLSLGPEIFDPSRRTRTR
jgi:pilus assembly protein CpaF